jgi:hypothetical protein
MSKLMAMAALSVAMLVGCNGMNKDDDMADDTKKMSIESKSGSCPSSCDKAKAK